MKNGIKKIIDIAELKNIKCDVLGLGVSNLPLVDMLTSVGAHVTAYDKKSREELGETAERLESLGVTLHLGEFPPKALYGDVIFRSPGIRPDIPAIKDATARGAMLTSEMELFIKLARANIIGITGSDGKTTTTTLTHLFLKKQSERYGMGECYVGGNIGAPLLSKYNEMTDADFAVLELSSFQLMTLGTPLSRCAITNLSPNHLNWHVDMDEYVAAKCNIFDDNSLLVLNAENPITADIASRRKKNMILFSSKKDSYKSIVPIAASNTSAVFLRDRHIIFSDGKCECEVLNTADIKLPGIHNIENYMTAIALTYGLVDADIYREVAQSFGGVPHRLEWISNIDGVDCYNSSIDSSPTRTAAALSALKQKKVVICGGSDKNIPFAPLAEALQESDVRCVVLTGDSAEKISAALSEASVDFEFVIEKEFTSAVHLAKSKACAGDALLLSPACASFDRFKNFEERGAFFKSIILGLAEDKN